MTPSSACLDLIRSFEGLRLRAYLCPAGVWTIGYGATGPDIREGLVWTPAQATERLKRDLAVFATGVSRLAPRTTQGQYDALVSFAFNLGLGALRDSTLLRLHNEGKYADAAKQFARWNKAGGRVLGGLTRRRAAEATLYSDSLRTITR